MCYNKSVEQSKGVNNMNLKEFRQIINKIPTLYDEVEINLITESQAYLIDSIDDIEWYSDDMDNDTLKIDITGSR